MFTISLAFLQLILGSIPLYIAMIGYLALSVEAILPIPQIISNHRARSCKGFRFSVLFSWILGDCMKMTFFFLADSSIPWAFKMCGIFQFACDLYLGVQYWQFGGGTRQDSTWEKEKDVRLA
jgi:solute carrier family 66, member 2